MPLLGQARAGEDVGIVEFSNIPAGYASLRLTLNGRLTANTSEWVLLRFNADESDRYDWQQLAGWGRQITADQELNEGFIVLGGVASDLAMEGAACSIVADVPDYASPHWHKTVLAANARRRRAGGTIRLTTAGFWRSCDPITSLTLLPAAGQFAAGTLVALEALH